MSPTTPLGRSETNPLGSRSHLRNRSLPVRKGGEPGLSNTSKGKNDGCRTPLSVVPERPTSRRTWEAAPDAAWRRWCDETRRCDRTTVTGKGSSTTDMADGVPFGADRRRSIGEVLENVPRPLPRPPSPASLPFVRRISVRNPCFVPSPVEEISVQAAIDGATLVTTTWTRHEET